MGMTITIKVTGEWHDEFHSTNSLLSCVSRIPMEIIQDDGVVSYTYLGDIGVEQACEKFENATSFKKINLLGIYGYVNFEEFRCACYVKIEKHTIEIELLSGYPMIKNHFPDMNWIYSAWFPLLEKVMAVESFMITIIK